MSAHPIATSIAHPPRRGRRTRDEAEARTLVGQLAHEIEGRFFGASAHLVYARETHPRRRSHDLACDTAVRSLEVVLHNLARHGDALVREDARTGLRFCADYWRSDQAEDAEGDLADQHERQAHNESRMGAGTIEALLSGRARGRASRRATPCQQIALGEGE